MMQNALLGYQDLIETIMATLDARDSYTASHSERVSDTTEWICEMLHLPKNISEMFHIAAHVHDIGKIGVPDHVLLKSSTLTDLEWHLMKKHSETGYQILSKVAGLDKIALIVRHHHERWDGKGYPLGLASKDIPIGSRIIALADSIDAMLSDRNYREAMSLTQCKSEIERNSGVMFDPVITRILLDNWPDFA